MAGIYACEVKSREEIAGGVFLMGLHCPEIAGSASPGQFVGVGTGSAESPLRRPFSVCSADAPSGTLTIGFQVKGKGTGLIAAMPVGSRVSVMGPLGNGFDLGRRYGKVAVVGGGVGVFPLIFLLSVICADERHAYMGFRDSGSAVMLEEAGINSESLHVSTEDGSLGSKGFVTARFGEELARLGELGPDGAPAYEAAFVCGPRPMIEAAAMACRRGGVRCQASVEERMACGFGACLACACLVFRGGPGPTYKRVCADGPVFDTDELFPPGYD
ncbi:MAG: dihydroorotate dehydrogenase electron transfer subunit [Oscillospiraceae bacterium]|nr:dihydroorotate dehydrogenase electron transfer subunit [Oscillospiraceae bacterium]